MSKEAKFWNRMAERYAARPVSDQASYQHKLETTRQYLSSDQLVLEIGCGTGTTALIHAPHVAHIHAIDVSSEMINIAKKKAQDNSINNVDFEVLSTDEHHFPISAYDVAMAHSILHLLPNRDTVIRLLFRALKPGGRLIVSTLCLRDGSAFLKYFAPFGQMIGLMPFLDFFTVDELEGEFIEAGFLTDYKWRPSPKKAAFFVLKKPHLPEGMPVTQNAVPAT